MSSLEKARIRDSKDPLNRLRTQFVIPTKTHLKSDSIKISEPPPELDASIYLCGNSLGLPPKRTRHYITSQLSLWSTKGVYGHFKSVSDSPIPPWLSLDDAVAQQTSKIVGALPSEVAIMQTLSANLHLAMASFYRPSKERWKVIIEGKAFPSDHYIVESQLRHHGVDVEKGMVLIEPPGGTENPILPTEHILSVIDKHNSSTALLLLPGVQFYTGQFFDIKTITAHARAKGIIVGWDLAHAVGNVPLHLHDWDVDFAAWCNYKYMNCGPGAIGGLFVHERHTTVEASSTSSTANGTASTATTDGPSPETHTSKPIAPNYRPRLSGWWGSTKSTRFAMTNVFVPIEGAGGFQLSNPSALDMSSVLASLSVFGETSMESLRAKSLELTRYLEEMLDDASLRLGKERSGEVWTIITPRDPEQRGAQLSVRLAPGLLGSVMKFLEEKGVVVDERKPDVIRIAPAPLYNTFEDVWIVVGCLEEGVRRTVKEGGKGEGVTGGSVMVEGGKESRGWSEIK